MDGVEAETARHEALAVADEPADVAGHEDDERQQPAMQQLRRRDPLCITAEQRVMDRDLRGEDVGRGDQAAPPLRIRDRYSMPP